VFIEACAAPFSLANVNHMAFVRPKPSEKADIRLPRDPPATMLPIESKSTGTLFETRTARTLDVRQSQSSNNFAIEQSELVARQQQQLVEPRLPRTNIVSQDSQRNENSIEAVFDPPVLTEPRLPFAAQVQAPSAALAVSAAPTAAPAGVAGGPVNGKVFSIFISINIVDCTEKMDNKY